MRIFYIDEFGNSSMSAASIRQHPWSALCALSIPDTKRISLADHMEALKDRFFPGWRNHNWHHSEIKGRYLKVAHRRLSRGRTPIGPPGYRGLTAQTLNEL